jgi:hypothetical protein
MKQASCVSAATILAAGFLVLAAAPERAEAQTHEGPAVSLALPCAPGFGRIGATPDRYECRTPPIRCPQYPQTTQALSAIDAGADIRLRYQCVFLGNIRYRTPCAEGFAISPVPNTNRYICATPAIRCPPRPNMERRTTALAPLTTSQGLHLRYGCAYDEPVH